MKVKSSQHVGQTAEKFLRLIIALLLLTEYKTQKKPLEEWLHRKDY